MIKVYSLQQLAAVAAPFVGQPISFAMVAMWAGNNQIFRSVRTTTGQWNNVIDMIFFANLYSTPIAFTLLVFVLALYILSCMSATNIANTGTAIALVNTISKRFSPFSFTGMAFSVGYTAFLKHRFFIRCIVFMPISLSALFIVLSPQAIRLLLVFFVVVSPLTLSFALTFWMFLSAFHALNAVAMLADISSSVFAGRRWVEFGERLNLTTELARLSRSIHSVSLSLHHMLMSADGVIFRRSGISLADKHHYTAALGGAQ